MFMRRIQIFHALSVFGDMKPHRYDDAIMIGSLHISNPANRMEIWPGQKIQRNKYASDVFEAMVKKLMEDGLLQRVENNHIRMLRLDPAYQIAPRDWDIQLTLKGRDCLGAEQIARSGDYSWYNQSGFDGTLDKASKLNPGLF